MRQPKSINTFTRYEVKAKKLKRGDSIHVGTRSYRVRSVEKNDFGHRVVNLKWGTNNPDDSAILIVPKNLVFSVTTRSHICTR